MICRSSAGTDNEAVMSIVMLSALRASEPAMRVMCAAGSNASLQAPMLRVLMKVTMRAASASD